MAVRSIDTLKQWFVTMAKPVQSQFHDWLDSFRHKNDKIGATDLSTEVMEVLNSSITQSQYTALMSAIAAGAKLYRYKQAENPKPNVGNDNTIYIEATNRPFKWEIWHNGAYYPVFNDVVTVPLLTDLNSLIHSGTYFISDILSDYAHCPPGAVADDTYGAILKVTTAGDMVSQHLTCNYVGADTTAVFVRTFADTVWTDWVRLLDTSAVSEAAIANWNAAYGWGNHAGLYEPKKAVVVTAGATFNIQRQHSIILIQANETAELYLPPLANVAENKIYEIGWVGPLNGTDYLNATCSLRATNGVFHHPLDSANKDRLLLKPAQLADGTISCKIIKAAGGWAVLQLNAGGWEY